MKGNDGPIEYIQFRQFQNEFNLKLPKSLPETWNSFVPKSSLFQISNPLGLAFYPLNNKGSLGFSLLSNKSELSCHEVYFKDDESFISSMCIDDSILYVAKGSQKIYLIDLKSKKLPFSYNHIVLDAVATQLVAENGKLYALFENNVVECFLVKEDSLVRSEFAPLTGISSISNIPFSALIGFSSISEPKVTILNADNFELVSELNLEIPEISFINSLFFINSDALLLGGVFVKPEIDDCSLYMLKNFLEPSHVEIVKYFDPCSSRPPRPYQSQFVSISNWASDLVDLVICINYASPDIGLFGRLSESDPYQTFYITEDEGVPQLPLDRGELTYPMGFAIDLTFNETTEDPYDPEAESFQPVPLLWILTSAGVLCPFKIIKSNDKSKCPLLQTPVRILKDSDLENQLGPTFPDEASAKAKETDSGASLGVPCPSTLRKDRTEMKKVESESQLYVESEMSKKLESVGSITLGSKSNPAFSPVEASISKSLTSTPSRDLSLPKISSKTPTSVSPKEKSLLGIPTEPSVSSFSTKDISFPANKAITQQATATSASITSPLLEHLSVQPIAESSSLGQKAEELEKLIKENQGKTPTELIDLGMYKNILLSEVANAHQSMKSDIFALAQSTLQNSMLSTRLNQSHFSRLVEVDAQTTILGELLDLSSGLFTRAYERGKRVGEGFSTFLSRSSEVKSFWNRIKLEGQIDWDMKSITLSHMREELVVKMDKLFSLLDSVTKLKSSSALDYKNTLIESLKATLHKVTLLTIHMAILFVCKPESSDDDAVLRLKNLNISTDSLLLQLEKLDIAQEPSGRKATKFSRMNWLLQSLKYQGARLIVPEASQFSDKILDSEISPKPLVTDSISRQELESFRDRVSNLQKMQSFVGSKVDKEQKGLNLKTFDKPSPISEKRDLKTGLDKTGLDISKSLLPANLQSPTSPSKISPFSTLNAKTATLSPSSLPTFPPKHSQKFESLTSLRSLEKPVSNDPSVSAAFSSTFTNVASSSDKSKTLLPLIKDPLSAPDELSMDKLVLEKLPGKTCSSKFPGIFSLEPTKDHWTSIDTGDRGSIALKESLEKNEMKKVLDEQKKPVQPATDEKKPVQPATDEKKPVQPATDEKKPVQLATDEKKVTSISKTMEKEPGSPQVFKLPDEAVDPFSTKTLDETKSNDLNPVNISKSEANSSSFAAPSATAEAVSNSSIQSLSSLTAAPVFGQSSFGIPSFGFTSFGQTIPSASLPPAVPPESKIFSGAFGTAAFSSSQGSNALGSVNFASFSQASASNQFGNNSGLSFGTTFEHKEGGSGPSNPNKPTSFSGFRG